MGGLKHPSGAVYGMSLQQIRLCGPALNTSCDTPVRPTAQAEKEWVRPSLAQAEAALLSTRGRDEATTPYPRPAASAAQGGAAAGSKAVPLGLDVNSNSPRTDAVPAPFVASVHSCQQVLTPRTHQVYICNYSWQILESTNFGTNGG